MATRGTKSPSQLERDIAAATGASAPGRDRGGARRPKIGKSGERGKRASAPVRPTPYRIKLTADEMAALEFARGRYEWPDMLLAHMLEDGTVAFTESDMWQWVDDVGSEDSPFALASPELASKLQAFVDSVV